MSTSETTSVSGPEKPTVATENGHQLKEEKHGGLDEASDNVDNEKGVATDGNADAASNPSPRSVHGISWFLVVASILMANFLFATDNTIAANIQPAVIKTFQSLNKLAWLGVAFMMSSWGTCFFWYVSRLTKCIFVLCGTQGQTRLTTRLRPGVTYMHDTAQSGPSV